MSSLKPKQKEKFDLEVLKVFLKHPSIFRHYLDIALLTQNENRIRTIQRSLERLRKAELLRKYRVGYYLNAELINSLYGQKTDIRKHLPIAEHGGMDRRIRLDLQIMKHFLSDPHGFWKVTELSMLCGRHGSTIQYNLDPLCDFGFIFKDDTENKKSKVNPIQYKLHPEYAMSLSSQKSSILKTIKETINQ